MKPKVLFIMHMPPPIHGASMMGKYIHDSRLVNEEFECEYINVSTSNKLNDIGKVNFQKLLSLWSLLKTIKKSIREFSPDLIYLTPNASGIAFFKDFLIIQFIKRYCKAIVVHYHNKGVSVNCNKWFYNKLYKKFFKGLKVILLTKELYPDISKYVMPEDVYYCANGIPTASVDPVLEKGNPDVFRFLFLFLSNMMRSKGVYTLIDACSLLRKAGFNFICTFVGDWKDVTETDFSHKIKALQLNNIVTAVGPKYGEEKQHFLSAADCFIFPSDNEAFGLVLLEAMQYGLPCISTNEGGIPSIIDNDETGFLVEVGNEEMLCDKMKWMIENPNAAKRMGEKGRGKFLQNYTLEAFEQRFVNILKVLAC